MVEWKSCLEAAIAASGRSPADLSRAAGQHEGWLEHEVMPAARMAPPEVMAPLCRLLGLGVEELVGREGEDGRGHPFRDSVQDMASARRVPDTPQTRAPAYRLAFSDAEFLTREELRPVRLQLELLKPQLEMDAAGIEETIVLFGGARIPAPGQGAGHAPGLVALSPYYEEARRFAHAMTLRSLASGGRRGVIVTGGGPGVMEAGNRGAAEAGGRSIGLNIVLPHEQAPNEWVTPELCFNFHYFALRKMHFLMRASAICVFPGGFGTLDEMFESLTLIQTGRMRRVPFLLFGRAFWEGIVNWQALADAGTISPEDLDLFRHVETAEEAIAAIDSWPPS